MIANYPNRSMIGPLNKEYLVTINELVDNYIRSSLVCIGLNDRLLGNTIQIAKPIGVVCRNGIRICIPVVT